MILVPSEYASRPDPPRARVHCAVCGDLIDLPPLIIGSRGCPNWTCGHRPYLCEKHDESCPICGRSEEYT